MIGIKKFDEAREYWLGKLARLPEFSSLAFDYPAVGKPQISEIRFHLDSPLASRLEQMGKGNHLSVYIILHTAFKILLWGFTGQDDLVVISPVYDTNIRDYNRVVLLRDRVNATLTFKEFLLQVRATVLEGYQRQYYPVEKLLDLLDTSRESPLFSFGLLHGAIHQRSFILDYCRENPRHVTVEFGSDDNDCFLEIGYDASRFLAGTVQSFMNSFLHILRQAVARPAIAIQRIQLMDDAVKERVLREFNNTGSPYPHDQTLWRLFYRVVNQHRERIAVWGWSDSSTGPGFVTYGALLRSSNALSRQLQERGIGKNCEVGLLYEPSVEMIIAILGVLGAGGAYLPMDPAFPQSRIDFMCRDSGVEIVVGQKRFESLVPEACTYLSTDDLNDGRDNDSAPESPGCPEDMAYTIYTSGTTGDPKGVQVEHRGVVNYIHWRIKTYGTTHEDVSLQPLSYCFDGFVSNMYTPLLSGGMLIMALEKERLDFAAMARVVCRHKVTNVSLVPGLFSALLDQAAPGQLESLRFVVLAGEASHNRLISRIKAELPNLLLINEYGPTEASVTAAALVGMDSDPGIIGQPIANTSIFILNHLLKPVPPGAAGQLYIAGPGLARSYVNSPTLTAQKFLPIPEELDDCGRGGGRMYASGDLARFRDDGRIQLLGRTDLQVKIRGHRIELEEIENRLAMSESLSEAVVVARIDENGDQYMCAYVVGKNSNHTDIDSIRRELEIYLPGYMMPRFILEVEKIERTVAGKVNRKALPEPQLFSSQSTAPPIDHTEKTLVDIWGRILNISRDILGIDADFFSIGGHSLNATRMVSLVHKELGATVTLAEIFEARTIRHLANVIRPRAKSHAFHAVQPAEERECYQLSPAQKRLFVLQQLELHSIAYNMPEVIELQEIPDLQRLEDVFRQLILRHESLRTSFTIVSGNPVQRIRRHVKFSIEHFQLQASATSDSHAMDSWTKDTAMKFVRPFDLAEPPLLRVGIVMAGEKPPVLLVDMHHIISDGVSMGILTEEFLLLMEGEALSPLRLQYKDYSQWLTGRGQEESTTRQREFWIRQFSDDVPVLRLPLDFSRSQIQDFAGDVLPFIVDKPSATKLKTLARQHDATLYMVLLALFNILISKLSLQEDIVVGTPLAGRRHADLERMIGMFVNTLALRNFPKGETTFADFLVDVRGRTLAAFENQEYQFDDLVEQLSLRRDISRNPLFDVMFSMQHLERANGEYNGPRSSADGATDLTFHSSKFDLTFSAVEREERIHCRMTFALRLFKRGTIETWIQYFMNVIRHVCEAPALPLKSIDVLDETRRKHWLATLSSPEVPYQDEKPVYRLLLDQVQKSPHRVAVAEPSAGLHITFDRLSLICSAGAASLRANGVGPGDIVVFMCGPGTEIPLGIFSILAAGASFLPIDPTMPEERVRYILRDSRASLMLTQRGSGGEYESDLTLFFIDEFVFNAKRDTVEETDTQMNDPVYVIYTSGTTGRPKGVRLLQQNLVNYIAWFSKTLCLGGDDRSLPVSSFAYDLGYSALFPAVFSGGRLTLVSKEDYMEPDSLLKIIARERISYLKLTPSFFAAILQHPTFGSRQCRHLRWIVLGGEAIIVADVERAWERCPHLRFMNHYGPTEATIGAVARVLVASDMKDYRERPTIGKPLNNTFAYVVDPYGRLLPPHIPGELCLAGAGLADGYVNRPELTAQAFTPLPAAGQTRVYHTGDLTVMDENGEIRFLGRKDHQVKIRGFRVEPAEVEQILIRHPQVKETVVLALNQQNQAFLVAYVVAGADTPATEAELDLYLQQRLPDYMIPQVFVFMEYLPLTANGKLDRGALPPPEFSAVNLSKAPETGNQQRLREIWSEVLGIESRSIGITDDFFRVGGHSLRATIMISKIQSEFGVRIPLAEVFKTPTIEGLARFIAVSDKEFYESIRPADPKPYYPQSSAQKRMFFLDQFEEIGVSYNMPFVLEVPGQLDIPRFQNTLNILIHRHETLRTSFGFVEGDPVQFVHQPEDIQFKIQEIAINAKILSHEALGELVDSFVRPFNLSRPPILRAAAVRLPEERNLLLFDIHHIIFDGSSRSALTDEFVRIHRGEELPPLRLHYKDFSVWQNRMFASGRIRRQEQYWLNVFSGELPILDLPIDFPRPPVFLFEGTNHDFQLGVAQSEQFKSLCLERGATLFMGLMAMFNVLLYKYSGQEDIVVGTGIAGRHHADLQHIVGMFVNSLAMRNRPEAGKSFSGFLQEVKEHSLQAFENQDVQFEDLVDKLNLPRDPSRNPLFSTTLVLQNFEMSDQRLEGGEVSRFEYENRASKVDLALFAQEGDGQLYFSFEYCTRLFKPLFIQRMARALTTLIHQTLQRPDDGIGSLDCVSAEEKKQLLRKINHEAESPPTEATLDQLWRARVEDTPHRVAISDDSRQFTFRELDSGAFRLACYLRQNRVADGMPVGILLDSSAQLAMAMLAVLMAGGAYVPMDPATPEERLRVMMDDAAIGIVLSAKHLVRTLNRLQWDCPGFHTYMCLDSRDIWEEAEAEESGMMDEKLWGYIGRQADNDIDAGGWISSYTGKPLSRLEMDEFGDNALKKLSPFLNPEIRALEIGCASGFTMYRVAPRVKHYVGTDLSSVIIERNQRRVNWEHIQNIELHCLAAHEISQLENQTFDLIIINSVIQSFHGHNYLRQVLAKVIRLMGRKGVLFIGDVMDQELKKDLTLDLMEYRRLHANEPGIKTKTDLSEELFVSRGFFKDWEVNEPAISSTEFSPKIHTIENELTRFRYDVVVRVDKDNDHKPEKLALHKYQHDLRALERETMDVELPRVSHTQAAYMIFTSGTSGIPKGIVIRHQNIVNYCLWRRNFYGFSTDDCALQLISPAFDGYASNLYPALMAGGKVVMIHPDFRLDYNYIAGIIQRKRVTHFSVVPAMYRELLECVAPGDLDSVRLVALAAEGADKTLLETHETMASHITLANEYGPTENAVATAAYIGTNRQTLGVIGKPVAYNHCFVLAKDLSLLPAGVPGELAVFGHSLGSGYLNRPELTGDCFVASPFAANQVMYRTGDRVRLLEDGNLEFIGRMDSQIKIRGFRVEIHEIEKRLIAHHDVRGAVVTPVGSGESLALAAYVESSDTTLKDYLSRFLPDYMIPSFFVSMETLPRNSSGKIDRKALPQPGVATAATTEEVLPGSVEERMRSVWADVLAIDATSISMRTNFFDVGGNSLKATALQRKIQREFDVKIPLADIFKTPTIENLTGFIDAGDPEAFSCDDPQLECLKRQAHSAGNLFLIHAGSGEVDGYAEFCSHLAPTFTCWGIKGEKPTARAPFNITIEELAAGYIKKILTLQPEGPYYLFGWCIGGTIAFEIARQLEALNREVAMLSIVNAHPPDDEAARSVLPFSVERELEWLERPFPPIAQKLKNRKLKDMGELWTSLERIVDHETDGIVELKRKIPPSLAQAIPNFDTLECGPLLDYFNLGRSLSQARLLYIPPNPVAAAVSFFQVQEGDGALWSGWDGYCRRPLRVFEVRGNHFSVFKKPFVEEFARLLGKLVRSI